ncbi:MAG: hypothetical protein J0L63_05125 [Anaerolineae bacterium]|nr:hypothetical protein [Anaerolineae bacterium]
MTGNELMRKAGTQRQSSFSPRAAWLAVYRLAYQRLLRPILFRSAPEQAHERMIRLLALLDRLPLAPSLLSALRHLSAADHPVTVAGVSLPAPILLAAGFVKGQGFASEAEALAAVASGVNIIPGWKSMPRLVGALEMGSFTRWPRLGNTGRVMWRDPATRSSQNRIGLKNPGARAAARFLGQRRRDLPPVFGINIAVSPGVDDVEQERREVLEAVRFFLDEGLRPAWFTLNISCPNTEDDPGAHQTESRARLLCSAVTAILGQIPLWVKLSPNLDVEQYCRLLAVFQETGVRAVIATNTLPAPAPGDSGLTAGLAGGGLRGDALRVVRCLAEEKQRQRYDVEIIGCGGVESGETFHDMIDAGAQAVQYWTGLIYRGPLLAALIQQEAEH